MTDLTYWEIFIRSVRLSSKVKQHLIDKISIIIRLYSFLCNTNDNIYIRYITDNIMSISRALNMPEEDFYINLVEWNSLTIDRETTDLLLQEYHKTEDTTLIIEGAKEYIKSADNYFIALSHFPFAQIIGKKELSDLIIFLLNAIEDSIIKNYL